jgi:hypothetical protein
MLAKTSTDSSPKVRFISSPSSRVQEIDGPKSRAVGMDPFGVSCAASFLHVSAEVLLERLGELGWTLERTP